MRLPRFTTLQLLLAAALIALVLGLFTSAWRVSTYQRIEQLAFSPGGNLLAARYSGGAVQVWRLDNGPPQLVAQAFGKVQLLSYDMGTMCFVSEDKLLKLEPDFSAAGSATRVRELTISTRAVREIGAIRSVQIAPPLVAAGANQLFLCDWRNPGQVTSYPLDTLRPGQSWPIAAMKLELSSDGGTLAVMDQNGLIHTIDAAGEEAQLAGGGGGFFALSGDGRTLAVPRTAAAGPTGAAVVSLYDAGEPALPTDLTLGLSQVLSLHLSADGRKLLAVGFDAAECYDVAMQQRVARIVLEEPPAGLAGAIIPNFRLGLVPQVAFAPSGQWLASINGSQIYLRELPGGRLAHVLTGGARWLQITIFTLGFAAWSAAWGVVSRRERLRQRRAAPADIVPNNFGRPVPTIRSQRQLIVGPLVWLIVVLALLFVCFSFGQPLSLRGVFETIGSLLGAFFGIVALTILYVVVARWFLGAHYFTLVRLRQITASRGKSFPLGNVQFWFAAPSSSEGDAGQVFTDVRLRWQELFGKDDSRPAPATLIAWLDRQCDLDALVGRHTPVAAIVPDARRGSWVVVCEETARRNFLPPLRALRAGTALMLAIRAKGGLLPGWVAGLITREVGQDSESPADLRAAKRRWQVLLARRPGWQPQAVLARTAAERRDLWLNVEQAEAWREVHAEMDLLATLHSLLLGSEAGPDRREQVLAWLRGIQLRDDPLVTLPAAIGSSWDDLFREWRAAIDKPDPAYDVPTADRQSELRAAIARQIQDRTQPWMLRERAVRSLGGTSYVGAAGCLIDLLGEARCEFRGEAIRSLENLSGRLLGDDPAAWQAWWQALPPRVRWQSGELLSGAVTASVQVAASTLAPGGRPGPPTPERPPLELKFVWGLMAVGGLTALAIPITFLFLVGPLIFLTAYFSLLVGVQAIVRAAGRETNGLSGAINLQAINVIACDPFNLLLAGVEKALLRRTRVQQYLLQINGGGS